MLPLGLLSTLVYLCVQSYKTRHKPNKQNVLLVHGSGFNQSEWFIGWLFLVFKYNVYSLNYAGLITNRSEDGIFDYVLKVRDKVEKIQSSTGSSQLHLIGHSMGGLICDRYADRYAKLDQMEILSLTAISTPWKGSPLLKKCNRYFSLSRRYEDMMEGSDFLSRVGNYPLNRLYLAGGGDLFVPSTHTYPVGQQCEIFEWCGHYTIIINPRVWWRIFKFLDELRN